MIKEGKTEEILWLGDLQWLEDKNFERKYSVKKEWFQYLFNLDLCSLVCKQKKLFKNS